MRHLAEEVGARTTKHFATAPMGRQIGHHVTQFMCVSGWSELSIGGVVLFHGFTMGHFESQKPVFLGTRFNN